ncbi:O-antigen ligase family protein [Rhodospirillaceae bacterium AH-315-P19]|nr:O-antigen ligase family protein [Rhodospirillaceae bacterium AH-315-P19]
MKLRNLHNGHLLAISAFLLPTLAVYLSGFLTPLLILMALAILGLSFRPNARRLKISWIGAAFFGAIALWGGVTAFWSVAPERSLSQAFDLISLGACGMVLLAGARDLKPHERRLLGPALLAGLGIAALFITIELVTDLATYHLCRSSRWMGSPPSTIFNRWTTVFALLVWPVLLWVHPKHRFWIAAAIFVLSFAVLAQLENSASVLALLLGTLAFLPSLRFPKRIAIVLICLTMAGTALAPWLPPLLPDPKKIWTAMPKLPTSAIHRIYIWNFVAERIEERPLLGWGLDTSRNIPGNTQLVPNLPEGNYFLPLHPHNAAMQWWLETGLVGAVICSLFMVWLFVMVLRRRMARYSNAVFNGAMVTGIVAASLSYGIWQAWWITTLFFVAAILLGISGEKDATPSPKSAP